MPTCLIVDDSPTMRKIARKMLGGLGFTCTEAGDGAIALGMVEAASVLPAFALVVGLGDFRVEQAAAVGGAVADLEVVGAHAVAPLRMRAMWMNFSGTPRRSAQPFWCIRQEESAETTYSAPAWA